MALSDFISISVCAETTALCTALLTLKDKKQAYWFLFIPFLIVTIAIELLGSYLKEIRHSNVYYYNFLMLVDALFILLFFYKTQYSKVVRYCVLGTLFIFVLSFIAEGFIVPFAKYHGYKGYSRIFLSCIVVLFSCIYFFSLLKNDSIRNPLNHGPFWIVNGLFFFYFGSLPMFSSYDTVSKIKLAGNVSFYTLVMGCLNCILYGSWIIGFLCRKKQVP